MIRALVRVDASANIGGGHLVRCLSLAEELRILGVNCEFAVCHATLLTVSWFIESGFPVVIIPEHYLETELAQAKFIEETYDGYDIVIVDSYGLGDGFEVAARNWAKMVVAIDDMPNRQHRSDVVIDPTFGRQAKEYETVAPRATVLAGADYTLLRQSFSKVRKKAVERREKSQGVIRRILIAFGASDPENYTGYALEQLMNLSEVEIDLLVGKLHPQSETLFMSAAQSGGRIRFWQDRKDIEQLMLECDLAIGGAGGQSWERCCLGLPSLFVEMSSNQHDVASVISENGAGIFLGTGIASMDACLKPLILELLGNPEKVMASSDAAFQLCDGLGAQRTAMTLFQLYQSKYK